MGVSSVRRDFQYVPEGLDRRQPAVAAVTPPAAGFLAPGEAELEEDWFGEGSAFDSGESLASALMALVGSRAAPPAVSRPEPSPVPAPPRPAPPARPADAPPGEFQVAAMPSFRRDEAARPDDGRVSASGWRPVPRPVSAPRSGWSIRQGVHILCATEAAMTSLREQAVERTWELVAAAYRDPDA